mmetsp:Transcript_19819/g.41590  ORF Transcript_19819/g.41590 Transcript_19819/m.41590 type:complete len:499 (+) Transcript_19819:185-1681(+)
MMVPSHYVALILLQIISFCPIAVASECVATEKNGECSNPVVNSKMSVPCLDASAFQRRVALSLSEDHVDSEQSLRGTIKNFLSYQDLEKLVSLLSPDDFVEASGYDDSGEGKNSNGKSKLGGGRAYSAPTGYSGLGLKELSHAKNNSHISEEEQEERYNLLLKIRHSAQSATETALNLCEGTLLVDFTTISEKTAGGAHRAHADNCLHYFKDEPNANGVIQKVATCDPNREHPYPNRVAASILYLNDPTSGNFDGGQFYFANRTNNGEVERSVEVSLGRMVYFTSGVESLHGALPVQKLSESKVPRRLALAMWYVFDPALEEFVPSFQRVENDASRPRRGKPKKTYDPNDPEAPKELFVIPIPNSLLESMETLLQSMGTFLVSKQNTPSIGSWKVSRYGDDTLHVLFKDHSAMFSLDFGVAYSKSRDNMADTSIVVERHTDGNKPPSLPYQLQESVILHGVLDELEKLLTNDASGNGQINFIGAAVEKARNTLPARRA